jgi:hypothetical protein
VREVCEELGIELEVGRLLCLEWQGPEPERTESLMAVYDGGTLPAGAMLALPSDELASYAFVPEDDLDGFLVPRLARRVRAALRAQDDGRLVELEDGREVGADGHGQPR